MAKKGINWVLLSIDRNTAVYFDAFDAFGIEYIPQNLLHKIKDKSILSKVNIIFLNFPVMADCGVNLYNLQSIILARPLK